MSGKYDCHRLIHIAKRNAGSRWLNVNQDGTTLSVTHKWKTARVSWSVIYGGLSCIQKVSWEIFVCNPPPPQSPLYLLACCRRTLHPRRTKWLREASRRGPHKLSSPHRTDTRANKVTFCHNSYLYVIHICYVYMLRP